jgi:hypothetical protein
VHEWHGVQVRECACDLAPGRAGVCARERHVPVSWRGGVGDYVSLEVLAVLEAQGQGQLARVCGVGEQVSEMFLGQQLVLRWCGGDKWMRHVPRNIGRSLYRNNKFQEVEMMAATYMLALD